MGKHTPGPWMIDAEDASYITQREAKLDISIAFVMPVDIGGPKDFHFGEETEANKHLIVAAPDLLAALESLACSAPSACCVDFHHQPGDYHGADDACPALDRYENACLSARAAIARARGEA